MFITMMDQRLYEGVSRRERILMFLITGPCRTPIRYGCYFSEEASALPYLSAGAGSFWPLADSK